MSDKSSYNQGQPQFHGPIDGGESYQQENAAGSQQYGYNQPPMQGQRPQHPLANYQFSSDEMRILRECNSESFFQRCVPLSAVLGLGSHLAVRNGLLAPNQKYGSVPKVVVSVIIGYFLGKISYQQKCAEKMMHLPNSKLGEILRQKKQRGITGGLTSNQGIGTPGFGLTPFSSTPARNDDVYDDSHLKGSQTKSSALELDTDRPTFGLDDSQNFGDLSSQNDTLPLEPPNKTVTYDELRKSNRDNYYKRMQSNVPSTQDAPNIVRIKEYTPATNRTDDTQTEQARSMPKNQYGDIWSQ